MYFNWIMIGGKGVQGDYFRQEKYKNTVCQGSVPGLLVLFNISVNELRGGANSKSLNSSDY